MPVGELVKRRRQRPHHHRDPSGETIKGGGGVSTENRPPLNRRAHHCPANRVAMHEASFQDIQGMRGRVVRALAPFEADVRVRALLDEHHSPGSADRRTRALGLLCKLAPTRQAIRTHTGRRCDSCRAQAGPSPPRDTKRNIHAVSSIMGQQAPRPRPRARHVRGSASTRRASETVRTGRRGAGISGIGWRGGAGQTRI